jgi:hypothetical protein
MPTGRPRGNKRSPKLFLGCAGFSLRQALCRFRAERERLCGFQARTSEMRHARPVVRSMIAGESSSCANSGLAAPSSCAARNNQAVTSSCAIDGGSSGIPTV